VRVNTPQSLYAAYRLVLPCASKTGDCADVTPGQVASRREWLARAAEAGMHGAVTDWFGELYGAEHAEGREISDADHVRLQRYIQIGVEHGDRHSLLLESSNAMRAGDDVRALALAIAAGGGVDNNPLAGTLRKGMSPDKIAKAEKEGLELRRTSAGRS